MIGADTGFFFALSEGDHEAANLWLSQKIHISAVVLYEVQKKLLQGRFDEWGRVVEEIERSCFVIQTTPQIAKRAAMIAHETKIHGLDALILASAIEHGCEKIYTTDRHMELYKGGEIEVVNLRREKVTEGQA